jgi:hypothetical protein
MIVKNKNRFDRAIFLKVCLLSSKYIVGPFKIDNYI